MMNLPGGATDIRATLRDRATIVVPPAMPSWGDLVWQAMPGQATEVQREQGVRLGQLQAATRAWGEAQGLPVLHATEAAFYAVVGTHAEDASLAEALARLVLWIYVLDDWYDHPATRTSSLRVALRETRAALIASAPTEPARTLLARQITVCAAAMRQELRWDALWATGSLTDCPNPTSYLANGVASIGMLPVMAQCCAAEAAPLTCWHQARRAIRFGGQVVRLANDLSAADHDARHGKLTALPIAARFHPTGDPKQIALGWLAQGVQSLQNDLDDLPPSSLRHCLAHVTAFAYAVYGSAGAFGRMREPQPTSVAQAARKSGA